jgi:hypothetical protein
MGLQGLLQGQPPLSLSLSLSIEMKWQENPIMRRFIICTPRQISLGWSDENDV